MAAKIGILGESTVTDSGTVTVYTVPTDKASRVRILYAVEGAGGTWQYSILVGTPGTEITIHEATSSGEDFWSGLEVEATPNPALSILSRTNGHQKKAGGLDLDTLTSGNRWILEPLAADYFLSDGDTVRFDLSGSGATDHLIQVLGVEDDA